MSRPIRLGQLVPRLFSRRGTFLLLCLSLLFIAVVSTLADLSRVDPKLPASQTGDSASQSTFKPSRPSHHSPPIQNNVTFAGSSWWTDSDWLVPYSGTSLDDDRVLLPPLQNRPPIYCYHDATVSKPRAEIYAEGELLLTWRRAWWSKGFRPVVIGPAEAMNNPAYRELQSIELDKDLRADMMRWLAWGSMGGGLLAHYTLLPIVFRDDPMLSHLRSGVYPHLTRWQDFDSGLLAGRSEDVNAVTRFFTEKSLKRSQDVVTAVPETLFTVDDSSSPLAYYSPDVVDNKFTRVAETIRDNKAKGLRSLNNLINSHLQAAWQSSFPAGIKILKPFPQHDTAMVNGALKLAQSLVACPENPIPASCPPNLTKCTPCIAMSPMSISTPARYRNSTRAFTIGTVPHPWTFALLENHGADIDISWIIDDSPRDPWLAAVTQGLLGTGVSGSPRVERLKEVIAGEYASACSIWHTAETETHSDMSWHFGFAIPTRYIDRGESLSPSPADLVPKKARPDPENGPVATDDDIVGETKLLNRARGVVLEARHEKKKRVRRSLEAWNLADTEAWKFVQAIQARRDMEREEWEQHSGLE